MLTIIRARRIQAEGKWALTALVLWVLLPPYIVSASGKLPWVFESRLVYFFFLCATAIMVVNICLLFAQMSVLVRRCFTVMLVVLALPLVLIEMAHQLQFDAPLTASAIAAVFYTDPVEASEYLRSRPSVQLLFYAAYGGVALSLAWYAFRSMGQLAVSHLMGGAGCGAVVALVILLVITATSGTSFPKALRAMLESEPWARMGAAAARSVIERRRFVQLAKTWAAEDFLVRRTENAAEIVVLVIGESVRSDHMSAFGYRYDTTPALSSRENNYALVVEAVAPATVTSESVPAILTGRVPMSVGPSLVSAAKKGGFETTWLSNQARYGRWDTPVSVLAQQAENVIFENSGYRTNSLDERLLPRLREALDAGLPSFVVIHLLGSHIDYERRYPPYAGAFSGEDYANDPCLAHLDRKSRRTVAAYDNSIRYTDQLLDRIRQMVQSTGKPAVMLYVSDHGEHVMDTAARLSGHGGGAPAAVEIVVPFVLWASDDLVLPKLQPFRENNPIGISTMAAFPLLMAAMGLEIDSGTVAAYSALVAIESPQPVVLSPDGTLLRGEELRQLLATRPQCSVVNASGVERNR